MNSTGSPTIHLATPRSLPKPAKLGQRVVVLDIAFASSAGGQSFETLTLPFIEALGVRLVRWIDHHDSVHHAQFADDPRFLLRRKAQHPACPELILQQDVASAGDIDTIVCHGDFDGLASAAKWLCGGVECYPGCDADARAIDSRIGESSPIGARIDRGIRGAPKDAALHHAIIEHLQGGANDPSIWARIDAAGADLALLEAASITYAQLYQKIGQRAVWLEVPPDRRPYDKTWLLLEGQKQARIALVVDGETLTLAAAFDSGVDFLRMFDISGGMPTVLSLRRDRLPEVLDRLAIL